VRGNDGVGVRAGTPVWSVPLAACVGCASAHHPDRTVPNTCHWRLVRQSRTAGRSFSPSFPRKEPSRNSFCRTFYFAFDALAWGWASSVRYCVWFSVLGGAAVRRPQGARWAAFFLLSGHLRPSLCFLQTSIGPVGHSGRHIPAASSRLWVSWRQSNSARAPALCHIRQRCQCSLSLSRPMPPSQATHRA